MLGIFSIRVKCTKYSISRWLTKASICLLRIVRVSFIAALLGSGSGDVSKDAKSLSMSGAASGLDRPCWVSLGVLDLVRDLLRSEPTSLLLRVVVWLLLEPPLIVSYNQATTKIMMIIVIQDVLYPSASLSAA
jgi:hypothetical protein